MNIASNLAVVMLLASYLFALQAVRCSWLSSFKTIISKPIERMGRVGSWSDDDSKLGDGGQAKKRTGQTDSSSGNSSDFAAMCLVQRSARYSGDLKLYYFSSESHSNKTLGCAAGTSFALDVGQALANESARVDDLLEGNSSIRTDLIGGRAGSFNASRVTYVLVHGFLASWSSDTWMCQVKDLILNHTDANVFIVDWSVGSRPTLPIDYGAAVANMQEVGRLLGDFLGSLMNSSEEENSKLADKMHLIGHSLGAHICGFAGYSLGGTLGRITALDPAGPCYRSSMWQPREVASRTGWLDGDSGGRRRLSAESAQLVVALHTDTSLFGLDENCAHYDVYVNGGTRQPKCASSSLTERLADLLSLNVADSLSADLTCAHSYAHKLVDTFASFLRPSKNTNGKTELIASTDDRCYSVAYECHSWTAYRLGECAFCLDNDQRCIFYGLGLGRLDDLAPQRLDSNSSGPLGKQTEDDSSSINNDDDKFNNDIDGDQGDGSADQTPAGRLNRFSSASKGQHFVRTGADKSSCLFTYQLLIATDSISQQASELKNYFYLQLPLDKAGKKRRLVQVSHRLPAMSAARAYLSNEYFDQLARVFPARELPTNISAAELDYHTALVTFRVAPEDKCRAEAKSSALEGWQLCRPLAATSGARLWASTGEQLQRVRWLALNYMSGLRSDDRLSQSHLLLPTQSSAESREQVDARDRPNMDELTGASSRGGSGRGASSSLVDGLFTLAKLPSTLLSKTLRPLDCLLSSLDPTQMGSSANNFKCARGSRELKFSIGLRPVGVLTK